LFSSFLFALLSIAAAHFITTIALVYLKIKPKIKNGELGPIESSGAAKLFLMFELYAGTFSEQDNKPWDYYYAGAFKVLHLAVLAALAIAGSWVINAQPW